MKKNKITNKAASLIVILFFFGITINTQGIDAPQVISSISTETENTLPSCMSISTETISFPYTGALGKYTSIISRPLRLMDDDFRFPLYGATMIESFWTPLDGEEHHASSILLFSVWATNHSSGEIEYGSLRYETETDWSPIGRFYWIGYSYHVENTDMDNFTVERIETYAWREIDDYPPEEHEVIYEKYIVDFVVVTDTVEVSALPTSRRQSSVHGML